MTPTPDLTFRGAAARRATELGIDLARVLPTVHGDGVTVDDVERQHAAEQLAAGYRGPLPFTPPGRRTDGTFDVDGGAA